MAKANQKFDVVADQEPDVPNTKDLLAQIAALTAQLEDNRAAGVAEDPKEEGTPGEATSSKASTKARYQIIVEESNNPGDPMEITPSVNGRMYQIRRGIPVDLPPEVLEVLDNAVQTALIQQYDQNGKPIGWTTRDNRRFAYTFIGKSIDEDGTPLKLPAYANRMR